ncbi:MAG: hypothetical protein O7D27_01105, partial [Alphaproteobacteria bacterium]|nr:hypothetical protein [Alphaproteobacteria bacterium]
LTAGVVLLLHRPAYAYLDPGTASIILQVVVGAVAAAGLYFRAYLARLFSYFRRPAKNDPGSNAPGSNAPGIDAKDDGDRLKNKPADGD